MTPGRLPVIRLPNPPGTLTPLCVVSCGDLIQQSHAAAMGKNIYVLGTGLSHDGSACLLKNGRICVAIEKERLTRRKHDGYNDTEAINYCLNSEGIRIDNLDLIVQNANYGTFRMGNDYFEGPRLLTDGLKVPIVTISHHLAHAYSTIGTCPFGEFNILIIDGSGSPYEECNDLDGANIPDKPSIGTVPHLYCEKDSYYEYSGGRCRPIFKDFSAWGYFAQEYVLHPGAMHSIGGLYSSASKYCFGNLEDVGKLMGLGPYGRPGVFTGEIFELRDGRVFLKYDWMPRFRRPARAYESFKADFQYYADVAYWVQREIERAIIYVVNSRLEAAPSENLCFAGGVALNAVANTRILSQTRVKNLYIEPAAADNGLSIGCAYYGWLEVLKKQRVPHNQSTCFGTHYPNDCIAPAIPVYARAVDLFFDLVQKHYRPVTPSAGDRHIRFDLGDGSAPHTLTVRSSGFLEYNRAKVAEPWCVVTLDRSTLFQLIFRPVSWNQLLETNRIRASDAAGMELLLEMLDFEAISKRLDVRIQSEIKTGNGGAAAPDPDYIRTTARLLAEGKVVGWFQDACEFGPRALGRRSILADPRIPAMRKFINSEIKFREDFRPFAPSVLREDASTFFQSGRESPYMILVDQIREEWREPLKAIVHEDGSCRVQTVTEDWNPKYYRLLQEFKRLTGISVLLNTSFNRRGMPIVETPNEALQFFYSCKLDCFTIQEYVVQKG